MKRALSVAVAAQSSTCDHEHRARHVLYWVDPMHPDYKSDHPGVAPDCGMQLEPVYAPGYAISWSGQYEAMERVNHRLGRVVPLTPAIVLLLLYANTRSLTKTMIILLAVPFSAVGAVGFLYLAGYNMSVGVWVGLIALLGIDAETGVYMLLYLDLAYEDARRQGRMQNVADLGEAIVQGAAKRLRPKFMTFATHVHRPVADRAEYGDGLRRHEAHRRPHGGRNLRLIRP